MFLLRVFEFRTVKVSYGLLNELGQRRVARRNAATGLRLARRGKHGSRGGEDLFEPRPIVEREGHVLWIQLAPGGSSREARCVAPRPVGHGRRKVRTG